VTVWEAPAGRRGQAVRREAAGTEGAVEAGWAAARAAAAKARAGRVGGDLGGPSR